MHKIQNLPVIFPLKDIDNYLIDRVSTRFQLLILALQHKQSSYVGVPFDSLHKSNLGWCRLGSVSNALNNRSVISRVSLEIWAHRDHLKMSCWWRWRHISAGDRVWKTESKTLFKKMKRWFDKRMCLSHQLLRYFTFMFKIYIPLDFKYYQENMQLFLMRSVVQSAFQPLLPLHHIIFSSKHI